MGVGALFAKVNIAKRIPYFIMSCNICGALKELNVHVLIKCPLAVEIWRDNEL